MSLYDEFLKTKGTEPVVPKQKESPSTGGLYAEFQASKGIKTDTEQSSIDPEIQSAVSAVIPPKKKTFWDKYGDLGDKMADLSASAVVGLSQGASQMFQQVLRVPEQFGKGDRALEESLRNAGLPDNANPYLRKDTILSKVQNKVSGLSGDLRKDIKQGTEDAVDYYSEINPTFNTTGGQVASAIGGMVPNVVAAYAGAPTALLSASEAFMNAEQSYDDNIKQGVSEKDALKGGAAQFVADMTLTYITNKFGALAKFSGEGKPIINFGKSKLSKLLSQGLEFLKDNSLETLQEVGQSLLQNTVTGKPFMQDLSQTAIVSFLASIPFSFLGGISIKTPTEKASEIVQAKIDEVNAKINNGEELTPEESAFYVLTNGENPLAGRNEMTPELIDEIAQQFDEAYDQQIEEDKQFLQTEDKTDEALFQEKREGEMFALRNIPEENIQKILQTKGMPAPSIAITKKGVPFADFGDVTLVGDKNLVKPSQDTKVYAGDIYSPTTPRPTYGIDFSNLTEEEVNIIAGIGYTASRDMKNVDREDVIDKLKEKGVEEREAKKIASKLFGSPFIDVKKPKPTGLLGNIVNKSNVIKKIYSSSQDFNDFWLSITNEYDAYQVLEREAEKIGKDVYDVRNELEYGYSEKVPYTAENIVQRLKEDLEILNKEGDVRGSEGGMFGARANVYGYKKFNSIKEIKEARDLIVKKEDVELGSEHHERVVANLVAKLSDVFPNFDKLNMSGEQQYLGELLRAYPVTQNTFNKVNDEYGINGEISDTDINIVNELLNEAYIDNPVDYFEAKIMRAVGLEEFKGALVPTTASEDSKQALIDSGLRVVEYDPTIEGDRQSKLESEFKDVAFQEKNESKEVSYKRGLERLKEYEKQYGVQFVKKVFDKLFTGKYEIDGSAGQAYGMYLGGRITLSELITETTADHEMVHFVLDNLDNIPVFKGFSKNQIMQLASNKWMGGKKIADMTRSELRTLEEYLAVGYEQFVTSQQTGKKQTFPQKLNEFFQKVLDMFTDFFSMSPTDAQSVEMFYDRMYFGKAKKGQDLITIYDTSASSSFMEARFEEFGKPQEIVEEPMFQESNKSVEDEYGNVINTENTVDRVLLEKDPLIWLPENSNGFEGISRDALNEWNGLLENARAELDIYESGGDLIQVTDKNGGVEFESYIRKQATSLNELNAADRQQKYVFEARDAIRNAERPQSKKAQFIYDHVIAKNFSLLSEPYQIEIAGLLDVFQQRKVRSAKEVSKDIKNVEKNEAKALRPSEVKRLIAQMSSSNANKVVTIDKKLLVEKIKNLNKGAKIGFKAASDINKVLTKEKIQEVTRKNELQRLQENITKRIYTKTILDTLRKNIPRKEWSNFMTRLTQVGTSEAKYTKLLESIHERSAEVASEKGENFVKAKIRSKIGYLKKIFDIQPSLILRIKKDLGYTKSIRKLDLDELNIFIEELRKRIQYQVNNPVSYLSTNVLPKEKGWFGKFWDGVKNVDKKLISPIERTAKKINNAFYESLMTVLFEQNRKRQVYGKKMEPLIDIYEKASDADKELMKRYGQSQQETQMRAVMEQYATTEEVDTALNQAREVLDEIHSELKEVGVEVPYRGFYFPRKLKKLDAKQAEQALQVFQNKIGQDATIQEKQELLNSLMRGIDVTRLPFVTLSGQKFETERLIETIDAELSPLYEDFDTALGTYVSSAIDVIETRRYFGKSIVDNPDYLTMLDQSIGAKVYKMLEDGIIKQEDVPEMRWVLNQAFVERPYEELQDIQKVVNNVVYPLALGQLSSTINQTKDLAQTILVNDIFAGKLNSIGNLNIKNEDVYLADDWMTLEGSETKSKSQFAQALETTLVPFSKADQFWLRVFVNGAKRRMVNLAKNNNSALQKHLNNIFGEEKGNEVMQEFAQMDNSSPVNDNMARVIFSEVARIRPITRLQKTSGAIKAPLFYVLKNFTVKQLEFVRSESLDIIYNGFANKDKSEVVRGFGRLIAIASVIGLLGASVDELKDWILGKENDESFWDKILGNLTAIIGFSKYNIDMIEETNFLTQFANAYLLPAPVSIIGKIYSDASKDVEDVLDGESIADIKTVRKFPLIGDLYYHRLGVGSGGSIEKGFQKSLSSAKTDLAGLDPDKVNSVKPKYEEIKKLGFGTPEADAKYNLLSEGEKNIYQKLKKVDVTKDLIKNTKKVEKVVNEIAKLGFGTPEGNAKYNELSVQEKEQYKAIKSKMFPLITGATEAQNKSQRDLIDYVVDYSKAYTKDPINAFKAMFTDETLGDVDGKLVQLERMGSNIPAEVEQRSQEIKKEMLEKAGIKWADRGDYKLEHIVPVGAGGQSLTGKNLKIVSTEEHDSYTSFDTKLSKAVRAGTMTRREGEQLARQLKIAKTLSVQEAINMIK